MDLELAGRTTIETGAGRGLGKAIALQRVDVPIVAGNRELLDAVANEISQDVP